MQSQSNSQAYMVWKSQPTARFLCGSPLPNQYIHDPISISPYLKCESRCQDVLGYGWWMVAIPCAYLSKDGRKSRSCNSFLLSGKFTNICPIALFTISPHLLATSSSTGPSLHHICISSYRARSPHILARIRRFHLPEGNGNGIPGSRTFIKFSRHLPAMTSQSEKKGNLIATGNISSPDKWPPPLP